ncbi:MAG TPA: hypothetical protein VK009_28425 [Chloroflexota bacterium]|nr:hypothetical protein [Chloroflexota bacterium]
MTNKSAPWHLQQGYNPWKGLVQTNWTQTEWRDWLERLSPRMLVLHMQRWSLLQEAMPGLSEELQKGIEDARRQLMALECHA